MAGKVFVGLWIDSDTRKRLKIACAVHDINQGDVMDLLLQKWLNSEHVDNEIKELINGREEKQTA